VTDGAIEGGARIYRALEPEQIVRRRHASRDGRESGLEDLTWTENSP